MKKALSEWISSADASRHLTYFGIDQIPVELAEINDRFDDYYLSLVGELFERLRTPYEDPNDWAKLGNALAQMGNDEATTQERFGISMTDALLFASTAFYFGGFSASAYVTARRLILSEEYFRYAACLDLITRASAPTSNIVRDLRRALTENNLNVVESAVAISEQAAIAALEAGPEEYIPLRLLQSLISRFQSSNIRAVLPEASEGFWNPLINSFLTRANSTWDFFPSQIQAIQSGLLFSQSSFSLQMPTGAGKTTLCEALIFAHLTAKPESVALLLVPYRSLASELRSTLVRRLNQMNLPSRCAYGGTVPSGDEIHGLESIRAIVATPEAISGLLGADANFSRRISLVICDEGHLLDGGQRGIGLELLLARMKAREAGSPKFVFISAIVPNIEEINSWLDGEEKSVVRSNFRPAIAEFGVLNVKGKGANSSVSLQMHPHLPKSEQYTVSKFLDKNDFTYKNTNTRRNNTYSFDSIKARAVAASRKVLPMGAVALFAANKRGGQGVVGLAEELLKQVEVTLSLPVPIDYADKAIVSKISEYLHNEYGPLWIGTRALAAGAVVHHGDIPQETREVLELALRSESIKLVFCTTTLAEGVNLPIRTLVLYSVQRLQAGGARVDLLARDIKNLVGRAGRAGATTKGLVLAANEDQWHLIDPVARQMPGEKLLGSLRKFLEALRDLLATRTQPLDNASLEASMGNGSIRALVEGVDATLIELATEEIGAEKLVELAHKVAMSTFAAQGADKGATQLLQDVFKLRSEAILAIRSSGRLSWLRDTGASTRMIASVETELYPSRDDWASLTDDSFESLCISLFDWAWMHAELKISSSEAFRLEPDQSPDLVKDKIFALIRYWLSGMPMIEIAEHFEESLDDLLAIHSRVVTYSLQTILEQGVALLAKLLESNGQQLSHLVTLFVERLRHGVPTSLGVAFGASGIRHRRALVKLGTEFKLIEEQASFAGNPSLLAFKLLNDDADHWQKQLGQLVYENTLVDLA